MLLSRVSLQHEAEHRDKHEQQGKQRDKAVVGDQGGELPTPVVGELLDHRGHERDARTPLLAAVESLQALRGVHLSE